MKKPNLFNQTDPFTSANYYQDNLRYLDIIATAENLSSKQPLHLHDGIEFVLICEGEGLLHVNGVEYPIKKGYLILTYPFHAHALEPVRNTVLQCRMCRFPLSLMIYLNISKQNAQAEISVLEYAPPCIALTKAERHKAKDIFSELMLENTVHAHGYDMALLSCVLRLMVIQNRGARKIIELHQAEERPLAWNALQYLQMHFHLDIDAASTGALLGVSARQLNSMLRLLTGMNFSKNLALTRIRNACAMMQFADLSLAFIARWAGYSSMPTFFRQFREIKGVTPQQFREQMSSDSPPQRQRFSNNAHMVLNYITDHYRESVSAADAAAALYLSEDAINHSLGQDLGLTFTQLLNALRLRIASGLLLGTDLHVIDIAINTGFNSVRTFNREFHSEFGTTPTAFRNSKKNEKLRGCKQPPVVL